MTIDSMDSVHVVWDDLTNYNGAGSGYDLFYKKYDGKSSNWGVTQFIPMAEGHSFTPSIVSDQSDQIHLVARKLDVEDQAILYKKYYGVPSAPTLDQIYPNPRFGPVDLTWSSTLGAVYYNVYRSDSPIYSIDGLSPIATVNTTLYIDSSVTDNYYYYAITGVNIVGEGQVSNSIYVDPLTDTQQGTVTTTVTKTETIEKSNGESVQLSLLPIFISLIVVIVLRQRLITHDKRRQRN